MTRVGKKQNQKQTEAELEPEPEPEPQKQKTDSATDGDYQPNAHELNVLKTYVDRAKANPPIRFKASGADGRVAVDHANRALGKLLVMEALGTQDQDFADGIIEQLAQASGRDGKVDVGKLNFTLSTIKGLAPQDPCETMLAVQMAAVHEATLAVARRLPRVETIEQQNSAEQALSKLARTFTSQMEALKRYRSKGEQRVTVQHVAVNEGGQAIVGNVTQTPPERTATRPSPVLALTQDTTQQAMPIIEPEKPAVPVARRNRRDDGR